MAIMTAKEARLKTLTPEQLTERGVKMALESLEKAIESACDKGSYGYSAFIGEHIKDKVKVELEKLGYYVELNPEGENYSIIIKWEEKENE
jgi:hypothetical protein